ncbi:MAG: TolC family protein [Herbaspirillum sp.]
MRRALLLALTLLTGCATYRAQPITSTQLARQFEERSLANDNLRAYIAHELGHDVQRWRPAHWNREMLTIAAYYYSPALDVARAQWGTAKAGIDVANEIPNPVLQLPFQYSTPNPGSGSAFTTGLALDIPLETASKRGYRVEQASRLSEVARLNIVNEAWKVRTQIRDALLTLYAASERSTILARKAADERKIAEMSRKRLAVGAGSASDINAAVLADTQAQSDLTATRSAKQDARARLAAAIGLPVRALDGITIDLNDFDITPPIPLATDARRDAVLHRTDLLASLANYAVAESTLQLEVAKQYPDIHLGPGYTYDTGTNKVAFGLAGITLPIFNQNQGGILRAEAKRKEAAARTATLQDAIIGDLDRARAHYQSSIHALSVSEEHLLAAQKQLASEAVGFGAGNVDRLTYTQAKAAYETSEIAHLDVIVLVQQAAGALEDTMQRPFGSTGFLLLGNQAVRKNLIKQEIER